jgi:hypothetical protein
MQQAHAAVREFRHAGSITADQGRGRHAFVQPCRSEGKDKLMHRNGSNLIAVALVATIGLGMPALAKSTHGGKANTPASHPMHVAKAQRLRALNANGSVQHSPTFGVPNPNNPALTGGGSTGYNSNLYVY